MRAYAEKLVDFFTVVKQKPTSHPVATALYIGVGAPSYLGGGELFARKNYTMPECVILETEMQRHYGQIA